MRLSRRLRHPRLGLELLERRDNPAGTVTAKLSGTILILTGTDHDNDITIQQTGSGAFTVIGNNGTAIETAGGLTLPASGVTALRAFLNDGNDTVAIDPTTQFALPGGASFNLGDGDNQLALVTDDKIDLGSLTILAGDGQDRVTVSGGAGTDSQVTGNVVVSLGPGHGPQQPDDFDTHADFARLAVHGLGGLKYTAADGNDQLALDTVTVDRAFSATGGAGSLTATTTDCQFGSVLLTGTASAASFATTTLLATRTDVAGTTALKTAAGVYASLTDVTSGPVTVQARNGYSDVEVQGQVTVNGNLTFTGFRHTLSLASVPNPTPTPDDMSLPSVLTVTGDLNMSASYAVDIYNYGSEVHARNLTITSPDGSYSQDYDWDYGDSRLVLAGNLTLRGDDSYFDNRDGQVTVHGNVLLAGGSFAGFDLDHGVTGTQVRTTVDGSMTLTATTGEAKIEADGTTLNVGGNLALTGAGWTDVSFGTEELSTVGGTVTVRGGPENDSFWTDGNFKSRSLTLTFKDGHNWVQIGGPDRPAPEPPRPSTIEGNVQVTSGTGTDSVVVTNARITGRTTISTGAGADTVLFQAGATFDGPVAIDLGAGADRLAAGLEVPNPFDPPNPYVPAGTVTFNAAGSIKFGTGNDTLVLGLTGTDAEVVFGVGGSLTVDGGANLDMFDKLNSQVDLGNVSDTLFE